MYLMVPDSAFGWFGQFVLYVWMFAAAAQVVRFSFEQFVDEWEKIRKAWLRLRSGEK